MCEMNCESCLEWDRFTLESGYCMKYGIVTKIIQKEKKQPERRR